MQIRPPIIGPRGAPLKDQRRPFLLDLALAQLGPAVLADVLEEFAIGQDQEEALLYRLSLLAPGAIEARGPEFFELLGRTAGSSIQHPPILTEPGRPV
jgi:hypothetical protein